MAVRLQLAPIIKGTVPDLRKVRKILADTGMKSLARDMIERNLYRTTEHWRSTLVRFSTRITVSSDQISAFVYPHGSGAEIWKYVSRGTSSQIRRIGKKAIGMRASYIPHTRSGSLDSGPGYLGTLTYRRARSGVVRIPGIEPRLFEEQVVDIVAPRFQGTMSYVLREAVQQSETSIRGL